MTLKAKALIEAFYGDPPRRSYWTVAQRKADRARRKLRQPRVGISEPSTSIGGRQRIGRRQRDLDCDRWCLHAEHAGQHQRARCSAEHSVDVRGAGDTGLPNGQQSDGVCQRAALGLFGPVALFPDGPPATIETTAGGTGAVHIIDGRNNPALTDGAMTEIILQLVDALPPAVPTIDLRTPCPTLLVR